MIAFLYPGFGADDLAIVGGTVIIVLIVLMRFLGRDPDLRRTRYGFFAERERYSDEEPLIVERPEHVDLPSTVKREIDVDEDTKTWPAPPSEGGKQ